MIVKCGLSVAGGRHLGEGALGWSWRVGWFFFIEFRVLEQQNDGSYLRLRKTAVVADRKVGEGVRLEAETQVIGPGTRGLLILSWWGR